MESSGFVVFIGFAILVVIAIRTSRRIAQKRREDLFLLAHELGFTYHAYGLKEAPAGFWGGLVSSLASDPNAPVFRLFDGFHPFGQGHSPDVTNLMTGRRGDLDWYLFDYSYKVTTSNGKSTSTTTYPFGIIAVRLPLLFPVLSLTPENFFHRLGKTFGVRDLSFELEEFNRRYFVQSPDAARAHDILHPQAIDFLMRHPVRHWQFRGPIALLVTPNHFPPAEIRRAMTDLDEFLALVPAYVRQDYGFPARWTGPFDQ